MSHNPHRPKLVFTDEPFSGRVYEMTLEKTTVGRGDHNTLTIHHPSVSQSHCEILVHGPEVIVRDLGSANGTFVNGKQLHNQQSQLKSGQLVQFGSVEARLELAPVANVDPASEMTAIYEHGRILRDQRRERNKPEPADPSMTLDDGTASSQADYTVVMPPSSRPSTPSTPATRDDDSVSLERKSSGKVRALIVAALVFGLAIVIWLVLASR